ncbi:hypothetical protein BpHYR1_015700 [Brachionus plicatilis]|uniref:Uncharacterized protein n=1 Tax=Brachionus plicatilis TaxID=10195 RepID=A0A3M7RGG7_BRAPC|nr:hypothetical protein BpHYR1_015700 [Brachionus plicatilis]
MGTKLVNSQTRLDEIVDVATKTKIKSRRTLIEETFFASEPTVEYVVVLFPGYVAVDHVEEQDAQRPHGRSVAVVAFAQEPLGRRVHPGAKELGVLAGLERTGERAGAKINQFYLVVFQVD